MAQRSQGIQQLLDAEKKAGDIIEASRRGKARRLKQARDEATVEVEQCRQQRDTEFHTLLMQNRGTGDDFRQEVEAETERQLRKVAHQVSSSRQAIIERLLQLVTDVRAEVHQNLQLPSGLSGY